MSTLSFQASSDVVIQSPAQGSSTGGLAAGDTTGGLTLRSGMRFGITPFLPVGATVLSATLRICQTGVAGAPYPGLGTLVVDRVDFGLVLDGGDFAPVVLTPNIGTLSSSPLVGIYQIDVTAAVAADLAAGDFTSDFLLRFTSDVSANGVGDVALIEDSENSRGSGVLPLLTVTYQ